jgi:hypothetical protein
VKNSAAAMERQVEISELITQEVRLGRIKGPFLSPPFPSFLIHPLHAAPKGEGVRLIHNLSSPEGTSVNDGISDEASSVSYPTLDQSVDAALALSESSNSPPFMAKVDLKDAYRQIPLAPSEYPLLVFSWQGAFYYDTALVMGARSACAIFQRISNSISFSIRQRFPDVHILNYLDDFQIIARSRARCDQVLQALLELCRDLNLPVNTKKLVWPTTCLSFLGIEMDSFEQVLRLPEEKLSKLKNELRSMEIRKKASLVQLQALLGLLNFCCKAIRSARPFSRRLIDLTVGLKRPDHRIRITKEVKDDLRVWLVFLRSFNGTSFFVHPSWIPPSSLLIRTDAAGSAGFGLIFGMRWTFGTFPNEWSVCNITEKEMFPVLVALSMWGEDLRNSRVLVHSDNMAVVYILNKQTSKDKRCLALLRALVLLCLEFNCVLTAAHVEGSMNTAADALSRGDLKKFRAVMPRADADPSPIPLSMSPNKWL